MRHLDLFSGIGGFAYATDQVWDNVEHIFCDNDPFCREVLKKHWPESEVYDDIRTITADSHDWGQAEQEQQATRDKQRDRVWLLTGGFPCQPFSTAGLRRGTADERHLWPEMLRVIRLTQPEWVIAENVRGILTWNEGMVFEQVCLDLEGAGYEVQPFIIPAVAVNAPHKRDRVWFVANAKSVDDRGNTGELPQQDELQTKERPQERTAELSGADKLNATNAESPECKWYGAKQERTQDRFTDESWGRDWHEVAAELCSVDDGLPGELGNLTLTKAGHRKQQLKAYGNAIVPQVAIEIMRGMGI